MRGQAGFFDVDERLKQLSAKGDSLERLAQVIDFELFRADLERAAPGSDRLKGGRPPFDHALMFKTLILQASHNNTASDVWADTAYRSQANEKFLGRLLRSQIHRKQP